MSEKKVKSYYSTKIEIRCKSIETKRNFKKIAVDFKNYESVILWLNANYSVFSKIVPSHPSPGGIL